MISLENSMEDCNRMRMAAAVHVIKNLTEEQLKKYCVVFGTRVIGEYDTEKEALDQIKGMPHVDSYMIRPQGLSK